MNPTAGLVAQTLAEYGEATRAMLAEYLLQKEPRRHHYDLLLEYSNRGGKMLRPSLCIATARAFGARREEALRSAAAIELVVETSTVVETAAARWRS